MKTDEDVLTIWLSAATGPDPDILGTVGDFCAGSLVYDHSAEDGFTAYLTSWSDVCQVICSWWLAAHRSQKFMTGRDTNWESLSKATCTFGTPRIPKATSTAAALASGIRTRSAHFCVLDLRNEANPHNVYIARHARPFHHVF